MMKKQILDLLILVILFQRTRADFLHIKEQKKIGSKSQLTQNVVEYLPRIVITRVVPEGDEKVDENVVRGHILRNLNFKDNFGADGVKNSIMNSRKKRARDVSTSDNVLHCLSCFANGSSHHDQDCYKAHNIPIIKCSKGEKCYSEFHPDYVSRGCKLRSLLNRTHVCKCPLCNDKPFNDTTYYDYKNVKDWEHDSERLEMPMIGIDILCKMCKINGTNHTMDNICRSGKNANYTVCERNQLCYMNFDGKNNYISRGCIDRPAYNSVYFFCNTPRCNNKTLYHFKSISKVKLKSSDFSTNAVGSIQLNIFNSVFFYIVFIFSEVCIGCFLKYCIVTLFVKNHDFMSLLLDSFNFYGFKMQIIIFVIMFLIIFGNHTKSKKSAIDKFVNPFPILRMKMEDVVGDQVNESVDEPSDNFVSFLIDNIKELFVSSDNATMVTTNIYEPFDSASILSSFRALSEIIPNNMSIEQNLSLINDNIYLPFIREESDIDTSKLNILNETEADNIELIRLLKKIEWTTKKFEKDNTIELRRTCISCNNVYNEDCGDPKNKLVPTTDCLREDDQCYSQHTPFGIVDRGCFNVNHDLMLFVCACNLCNYISISEMPYIFSNKKDWVQNVIEVSRAKHFRESIFKDMSCLRCEVNVTAKRGNTFADANCLEGNITALPKQICTADEICGVKAVRSEGYIWRGCVTEPLYNYWWTFCDKDSCNYDAVVSIYDTMN